MQHAAAMTQLHFAPYIHKLAEKREELLVRSIAVNL